MSTFILSLPASEVVRLLKTETKEALGQPELNTTCCMDYIIEEDFDRALYDIEDSKEFDLVTSVATLTIEPRVERGYWILSVVVERELGPTRVSEEDEFGPAELTLNQFEAKLDAAGKKRVTVRLVVETLDVRHDFDRWLADMQARHPAPPVREPEQEGAARR